MPLQMGTSWNSLPGLYETQDADKMDTVNIIIKYTQLVKGVPKVDNRRGEFELCDVNSDAQPLVSAVLDGFSSVMNSMATEEKQRAWMVHYA